MIVVRSGIELRMLGGGGPMFKFLLVHLHKVI